MTFFEIWKAIIEIAKLL